MDRLLTVDEVAELVKVQPLTVREGLKDGKLVGHKVGGRFWRVFESDLEAFVRGSRREEE